MRSARDTADAQSRRDPRNTNGYELLLEGVLVAACINSNLEDAQLVATAELLE